VKRIVRDHSHKDGLAGMAPDFRPARPQSRLGKRLGRPRREAALDDLPRRVQGTDELVSRSRVREVVLPAKSRRVVERRRLRAGLLEYLTQPEDAGASEMRRARPDRPGGRADGER